MSSMVAQQLDVRHGKYLLYFSTNRSRSCAVGCVGRDSVVFLGSGEGGFGASEISERLPARNSMGQCCGVHFATSRHLPEV